FQADGGIRDFHVTGVQTCALPISRSLHHLRMLTLSPRYMSHQAHVIVARDLYPQRLPGDEPEELEPVPWKLDALHELVLREDFSEGRAVAALFMTREWLRHGGG